MEYKYTTDGKKVAVIGQLNSKETIVQEIFVTNGQEFPGGENFIVKSLLDTPAVSWKEKEVNKIEERFNRLKPRLLKEIRILETTYNEKRKALNAFIRNTDLVKSKFSNDSLETLIKFQTGEITHLAICDYNYKIIPFFEKVAGDISKYDSGELKLVSLYGRNNGDMSWRVGRYSDDSGSYDSVIPCGSFQEAIKAVEDVINKKLNNGKKIDNHMLEAKEKYNLSVPTQAQLNVYYKDAEDNILKRIEKEEKSLIELKNKLTEYQERQRQ